MSRPININETLTFSPSAYVSSTAASITNQTNPVGKGSNNTTYAQVNLTTGSGATTEAIWSFDCSSIPAGVTITSVTCSCKCSINTTTSSRVTTRQAQLYSGTTAKGSAYNVANTTTAFNITCGSWTRAELQNARIRLYAVRGTSNTSTNYYFRFYGATLSVTYSIQGIEYEIISTLGTDAVDSISPAGQTYVTEGNNYELYVYANSLDNISITDNGTDVTSSLVRHNTVAETNTFTGIPTSFDSTDSVYDSVYNSNNPSNGLTAYNSSTRCCVYVAQTAYAEGKLVYNFDCSSIPANAIITSVTCQAGASCYSSGQYFNTRTLQLYSGNTAKGTAVTITGNGSTSATHNIDGGSWTRAELDNIKIVAYVARGSDTTQASFSFFGATLTVNYTIPIENPYYWTYTLSNISADHTIILTNAIIEIPEEDPQYDYYPITVSSINATTDPGRGTTRVVEGTNRTITIYPDDPQITLVTDNGTDITNQLVQHGGTIPNPTVATATGASYGFTLNSSTGYYVSQNTGVASSAAVCRVTFNLPVTCLVTIQYINYAEGTYDYGIFGNIDTALGTTYTADSNAYRVLSSSSDNSASAQTLTYNMLAGEHYIDIKYRKDSYTDSNNDSLQWKIASIEPLETNNYYTYTISNIQEAHSLIFIFGDVTYYFVSSSGTGVKLFPDGSMVQLPGDFYSLTIVPDDYSYEVSVSDNNADVTSQVQRKEEEITKDGNTYTVVNYIYKLSNIQATHNIVVQATANNPFYVRVGNSWVKASKVYVRSGNQWSEVQDYDGILDLTQVYRKG